MSERPWVRKAGVYLGLLDDRDREPASRTRRVAVELVISAVSGLACVLLVEHFG